MLISHRYRFIYIKTAKTASTSIEAYFEKFCMPEGEWTPSHGRTEYESASGIIGFRGNNKPSDAKWWNHMPASEIKNKIGDDIWNSYFKFCSVRNPFEKCISAFSHFGKKYQAPPPSLRDWIRYGGMSTEQYRFYNYLKRNPPIDFDKYTINGQSCLDDVIHYESLQEDLERICKKIGVPFSPELLPSYKKGIRSPDATIKSLYTKRAKKLVEKKFAYEIKNFGYTFPRSLE